MEQERIALDEYTKTEFVKEEYLQPNHLISDRDFQTLEAEMDRLLTDYCNFVERPKDKEKHDLTLTEFLNLRNQAILDIICINTGGSILSDKVYQVRVRGEND